MAKRTVFITGGAGFIGSRLAARLSDSFDVVVYDNLHPQVHDDNPDNQALLGKCGARLIEADVCNGAQLKAALSEIKPDIVYHLAAETGTGQSFDEVARYSDVNVMGTAHLIEAIRASGSVSRVILAGSRSVYGEGACVNPEGHAIAAVERRPEDLDAGDFVPKDAAGASLTPVPTNAACPVAPASIYASTKLMQEYMLKQAFWGTDIGVGILRLQNVYGAGQSLNNPYTGVLSIFSRQIQNGKVLNIYEDGDITRDFVHVDDVVRAFAALGEVAEMPSDIVDIGSGEGTTIRQVAEELLDLFSEPRDKYEVTGAFRPGDIRYAVADITAAQRELHWTPKVALSDGLADLVRWSQPG